ncbi:MAG: hypothetical protein K6G48_03765 [Acholeplasmatales bacterium]|nr:hypothetical protein [Acholeplasmatales bacterium]
MAKGNLSEKLAKDRMVSLFRRKKLIVTLIVLFLLLATTIGLVTYYGLSTGGFTINIDDELSGMGIVLKESVDGEGDQSLNAPEYSDAQPISQPEVNEYFVLNNDGGYTSNAGNYIGYTFYLGNTGTEACDIETTFKITENTRDVASAARFWVFISHGTEEDGQLVYSTKDTTGTIYKKAESSEENEEAYQAAIANMSYKDTVDWNADYSEDDDENIIYNTTFLDFNPGEDYKISIIMWLDGNDPDCVAYYGENNERMGIIEGKLKIGMSFEAYHESLV